MYNIVFMEIQCTIVSRLKKRVEEEKETCETRMLLSYANEPPVL